MDTSFLAVIFSVIVISLSGVMIPGPMFAITVAKSYHSPWAGAKISIGHAIAEIPIILLIYFGYARFFQHQNVQLALSLLGGGMFVWLGINMFRARREIVQSGKDLRYGAITAGIIMSVMNPLFLLWWATVGSMLVMKSLTFGTLGFGLFIPVHLGCDFIWLSFVSVLVYKTRSLWGRKFQTGLLIASGILLVGFGVWFLGSGVMIML